MKKSNFLILATTIVVLAGTVLFTSCEKEELLNEEMYNEVNISNDSGFPTDEQLADTYCSIDSMSYYMDFWFYWFQKPVLLDARMCQDGKVHIVAITDISQIADFDDMINDAKKDVYKTTDSASFYRWCDAQVKAGNVVKSRYDKETGTYMGVAYPYGSEEPDFSPRRKERY